MRGTKEIEIRERASAAWNRNLWESWSLGTSWQFIYVLFLLTWGFFLSVRLLLSWYTLQMSNYFAVRQVFVVCLFIVCFCLAVFSFNHCLEELSLVFPCKISLVPNKFTPPLLKCLIFVPSTLQRGTPLTGGIPPACLLPSCSSLSSPSLTSPPSWAEQQMCCVWNEGKELSLWLIPLPTGFQSVVGNLCSLDLWKHHSIASPEGRHGLMGTLHINIQETMWFWSRDQGQMHVSLWVWPWAHACNAHGLRLLLSSCTCEWLKPPNSQSLTDCALSKHDPETSPHQSGFWSGVWSQQWGTNTLRNCFCFLLF